MGDSICRTTIRVIAIVGVALSAGCGGECEPAAVPGAFVQQPRGAGCASAAECADGLSCVASICTTSCNSDAQCSADTACVLNECLLRCAPGDDAACAAGATAGACATFAAHGSVCVPRMCFGNPGDAMCPTGYRCVGARRWTGDTSGAGGVGGPYCPTTGWCQQIPAA